MASPSDHDPETCQAGDECKLCQAEFLRREVSALARQQPKRRPTDSQKRTALTNAARRLESLQVLLLVLLMGCAPIDIAADHAAKQAALTAADAMDDRNELPPEARIIAADCFDAWEVQYFTLTGKQLPGELVAQVDAAREAAEWERSHGVAEVTSR